MIVDWSANLLSSELRSTEASDLRVLMNFATERSSASDLMEEFGRIGEGT